LRPREVVAPVTAAGLLFAVVRPAGFFTAGVRAVGFFAAALALLAVVVPVAA
jgi:hypothetical protein